MSPISAHLVYEHRQTPIRHGSTLTPTSCTLACRPIRPEHAPPNSPSWMFGMDHPKHRWLVLFGFALIIAVAMLLLLNGQRTPSADPPSPSTAIAAAPAAEQSPLTHEPPANEPESAAVAASTSNTVSFRGQVIDVGTRKPVEKFEIKLTRAQEEVSEEPDVRQFSSPQGRFKWDVEPGTWRVSVSARGYQTFLIKQAEISNDAAREIVMPLLRGFSVRGRVVDALSRAGIADATLTFKEADELNWSERSSVFTSDQNGEFSLDGVPAGEVIVSISAPKHAYREVMIIVDDKTQDQEIELSAGGTLSGVVLTTSGGPAKGRIYLRGPGPASISNTTDAGEFSFRRLPAGRYQISADTSAGGTSQGFHLNEDEIKEGVVLVVGAGRSIRGIVKGPKPEQLQDVGIALHTESTNSFFTATPTEDGTYLINGVPPGAGMMTVHGETFRWQQQVKMPADQDLTLDIVIPSGSRLAGRVTRGGKPAPNKIIVLKPTDAQANVLYQEQADDDGLYQIENLGAGAYLLRAEGDISRPITIAGDSTLNIDIPSTQLSARVVEDSGAVPIVGATVYLRGISPETSRVRGDTQTDDFGQFELTGIEPGDIALNVYKPGYEMHRETISYSTPITNKTITLRKDKGVEVRIAPGSRRFPRGFTLTQRFPHSGYIVDLWMPINFERLCYIPSALAGTTFEIGRFSGEPIVFKEWDGLPFELP